MRLPLHNSKNLNQTRPTPQIIIEHHHPKSSQFSNMQQILNRFQGLILEKAL